MALHLHCQCILSPCTFTNGPTLPSRESTSGCTMQPVVGRLQEHVSCLDMPFHPMAPAMRASKMTSHGSLALCQSSSAGCQRRPLTDGERPKPYTKLP